MSNPRRKRRILRSLDLREVSAVDRPAQAPAGAILRKSNTMNDPESVIADALAVRDDGAEPQFDADMYEQAILHEARLENSATETFAQVLARVASNGNDHVDALVFAAQRVRDREAAASVGKAAAAPSPVALDAERVRKGLGPPRYTRTQYEDEMMEVARKAARSGETPCASFARLAHEGVLDDLYQAAEAAEVAEESAALEKGVSGDPRFDRLLMDLAKMRRAPGETIEGAAARLLTSDRTVMDAYAAVSGH